MKQPLEIIAIASTGWLASYSLEQINHTLEFCILVITAGGVIWKIIHKPRDKK